MVVVLPLFHLLLIKLQAVVVNRYAQGLVNIILRQGAYILLVDAVVIGTGAYAVAQEYK